MGSITDALHAERMAFLATLIAVGPDAPTACGTWTTTDLAAHVALGDTGGGLVSGPARLLVGRGVRMDRVASLNRAALAATRRRRDFDWALASLSREAPRLQRQIPDLAAVSLLEVWAHHEDILNAHDLGPCASGADVSAIVPVLIRYQHSVLANLRVIVRTGDRVWFTPRASATVEVVGPIREVCRWLSGRGPLDALTVEGPPHARAELLATPVTI